MNPEVIRLLDRVKTILPDNEEWFRVVREWYSRPQFAVRVIEGLLGGEPCQMSLAINGQVLEANFRNTDRNFRKVTWIVPAQWIRPGENAITVAVEQKSAAPLCVVEAGIEKSAAFPGQMVDLSVREPRPSPVLALTHHRGAAFQNGYWQVNADGGRLQFTVKAPHPVETGFTLTLAAGAGTIFVGLLKDLARRVWQRLKKRIHELWETNQRMDPANPAVRQLRADFDDLDAYRRLHEAQIEPAIQRGPDVTLDEVIRATGDPASLIAPPSVVYQMPRGGGGVESTVRDGYRSEPRLPRVRGTRFATFAKVLVILIIIGGGAYWAWASGAIQRLLDAVNSNRPANAREFEALLKEKNASAGEVQVSLFWENMNDLDLHVIAPSGDRISTWSRQSKCGGKIDVDMNILPQHAKAVENIFWKTNPPKGKYKIVVVHFNRHPRPGCEDPTRFTVRLDVRGKVRFFNGEVVRDDPNRRNADVHEFVVD